MLRSYKPVFTKTGRKMMAIFCAIAILITVLSASIPIPVLALSGNDYGYKPAESNIACKYWVSASASSNSPDAGKALDNDAATDWSADEADNEKWFMVDLGGTYDAVRKTEVVFPNPACVYKYILEGSSDGNAWTLLADRRGNTRKAGGFTDLFKYVGLRYIKLTFLSEDALGIKDFKIFNYLRDDMDNGADTSGFFGGTIGYNNNNNPVQPGYRGGTMNAASMNTGENFFGLTKDMGWDTIRLRIWNDPKHESDNSWWRDREHNIVGFYPAADNSQNNCSPVNTQNVAKYIVGADQRLAIDFHYADSWSDPQNQPKPYAWANLPWDDPVKPISIPNPAIPPEQYDPGNPAHQVLAEKGLVTTVYDFTYDTIKSLIEQDTAPSIVALGNEITNGMLWGSEYELTNEFADFHDYFCRFIRGRGEGDLDKNLVNDPVSNPRGPAPKGGGVKWVRYEQALKALEEADGDTNSEKYHEYEELYAEFLESINNLSILINAGQRAIDKLNDEYGLNIETELHFAFNVFEQPQGQSKIAMDVDEVFEKVITLVGGINEDLNELGTGMSDRIGISYYPDWHGTYDVVQKNIVELSKMLPGVKFNISECWNKYSGTVNANANGGIGWMDDPNVVRNPMNPDQSLPLTFTYNREWQGTDVINIMKLINDVPNNVGMGVWPWNAQSTQRGYFTGNASGQPYTSFLAFSEGFASNAVESGIYITTEAGTAPELPATVKNIDAKTGVITDFPVTWNAVDPASYAQPGTFTVTNTAVSAKGVMREVKATVTVIGSPEYSLQFTTDADGVSTALFTVDNTYGARDISVLGTIAAYNEIGALVDTQSAIVEAKAGTSVTEQIKMEEMPYDYSVKAFEWDAQTYVPLTRAKQPMHETPVVDPDYRYAQHFDPIDVVPVRELYGREDDFIRGMDVSSLGVVVDAGGEYYDMNGKKLIEGDEISNALAIMKKYGTNWIRLRLWNDVTPFPSGMQDGQGAGGQNDIERDLVIAKKAHDLGLKVLIDYHYSDTWADPGRQIKPRAWTNIATRSELEDAVYDFTKDTLRRFVNEAGFMPEMVQIGNETNSGFMYHEMNAAGNGWQSVSGTRPSGSTSNMANHAALLNAGIKAVRDVDPNNANPEKRTKVMYHLAYGSNHLTNYRTRAQALKDNNVDYDVMGFSYYPYYHGTIAQITPAFNAIATEFGKEVVIAETSWGYTYDSTRPYNSGPSLSNKFGASDADTADYAVSVQGQADELRAVSQAVAKVADGKGLGVFYWEPAWIPTPQMGSGWVAGNSSLSWANQGYFDYLGRAMPSLGTWERLFPDTQTVTPTIIGLADESVNTSRGTLPDLPETVKATYSDDSVKDVAVTWDSYDQNLLNEAGTFEVFGTVAGTLRRAKVTVTVLGSNFLLNPGFENGSTSWTLGYSGSSTPIESNSSNAHSGNSYFNYWTNVTNVTQAGETYQTVNNIPTGKYTLSCWIKGNPTGSTGVIEMFIETPATAGTKTTKSVLPGETVNNTWREYKLENVPITGGSARVGVKCTRGGSNVWITFDDFELQKTGELD